MTPAGTNEHRAAELLREHQDQLYRRTDRLFGGLMVAQWIFAIVYALVFSPYGWADKQRDLHLHVVLAVVLGGAISGLPIVLVLSRPGHVVTRNVVAVAQMMWSALLVHLSGGRIETHFHVFGSLAFLAFYRDWRILVPATVVIAADHLVRQMLFPESVFGISNPEWWRFIEHALWVVFEDTVLVMSCIGASREMRQVARTRADVEMLSERERAKSEELSKALGELHDSQESLVRAEKLVAVGQLAASVGHELRNPLAAVRNAGTYITKKLRAVNGAGASDPRVAQFLGVIDKEVAACDRIISELLDFARERPPSLEPCPLRTLADDAISIVIGGDAKIVNAVPDDLPIPSLDKDQYRQVLVNLIQNAAEAVHGQPDGTVEVTAEGGGADPWVIKVRDNGSGIAPEAMAKIFEPLFTTKTKGTGLGLAIVHSVVRRHNGHVRVESEVGAGTTFILEHPALSPEKAAVA